jgi:hypothetical protein
MGSGIQAEIAVHDPRQCPVAPLSEDATITAVTQGRHPTAEGERPVDLTVSKGTISDPAEEIFRYERETVYRITRPTDLDCACDRIEKRGCPVRSIRADDGSLLVTFIAPDLDTLQAVVADLKEVAGGVSVRCLVHAGQTERQPDLVFVDRTMFTERQREVLERAHELGFFDRPKQANSEAVADELGISVATFAEHLAAAQTKLMTALFDA